MRIFRHSSDLPATLQGAAVAIGNFDGVHRGHRAVIAEAGQLAHAHGRPWAVLTFEPHPRNLFRPNDPPFQLTLLRAKTRSIAAIGVDFMVALRFDAAFASLSADEFIRRVLVEGIHAGQVVAGYDFVFGKGRTGNCELLLRAGRTLGFDVTAVHAVRDKAGEVLSSSRARDALRRGDAAAAAAILGRAPEIEGRVMRGKARGRTLGFPTANIPLGNHLRPAGGVYAVRAAIEGEPLAKGEPLWRDGVANIGRRPTFGGDTEVLEVFLFDFTGDLYGRRLRVRLIEHLRQERTFDGIDSLRAQIAEDSLRARRVLTTAP
ncbi:MAG: bifunctional riboflavin kinase/FAD synthetase [Rhodospirillales bacterium]|nr:bifunctional riboflavin kinase/FAD synthetase [Rhodospirillales bacterium]MSP80331.1 bifunctional riboflavin kinase/FAD synthetase [Rhodospirillales bacterium]